MSLNHEKYIRIAINIAQRARDKGDEPFGAVLVDENGKVLCEGENTILTEHDCTGHAETNVMRMASRKYDRDFLSGCTLYTSTEPCAMCCGAIFWGNVRKIVFGLSEVELYGMIGDDSEEILNIPSRDFFRNGNKSVEVIGPILESEAKKVHLGFWGKVD